MSRRPVSLRVLLLVPLVLQMAVTAALISLVSYQGKQQAAAQVAARSQQRASRQVHDYLTDYLQTPQQVIRLMADAVESGRVDPGDRAAVVHLLWLLQRTFPGAPYLNFGWADGDFIGLGQVDNANREPFLEVADAASIQRLQQIRLDAAGQPLAVQRIKPFGDFRSDGWYAAPRRAGRAVWTPIYNWVDAPEVMAMGVGVPVRRAGAVIGVAGVDVFLANIGQYLRGLPIAESAEVYIVERDGHLVADASGHLPFTITAGRGVRRRAQDATEPLIRASARALVQRFGDFGALNSPQQLRLPVAGGDALVRVEPYRDAQGLDWRIVVVIPESELYGNLRQEAIGQLLVSLVAILVSGGIALVVVEFVIRHLDRLVRSSDAMADGDLSQSVEPGRIREMARLAESFNAMAIRLRRSFSTLRARNREIARLASERSEQLALQDQQLQGEIRQRQRLERSLVAEPSSRHAGLLADPTTGLFSRQGLERRLREPARSADGAEGALMLVLFTCLPNADALADVALDPAQLSRIAEVLEPLASGDRSWAAHLGAGLFAALLVGADPAGGQVVAELLEPLAAALQPWPLLAGLASAPPGGDADGRLALLGRAQQALDALLAERPLPAPGSGLRWRFAPA